MSQLVGVKACWHKLIPLKEVERDHLDQPERHRKWKSTNRKKEKEATPSKCLLALDVFVSRTSSPSCCRVGYLLLSLIICCTVVKRMNTVKWFYLSFVIKCITPDPHTDYKGKLCDAVQLITSLTEHVNLLTYHRDITALKTQQWSIQTKHDFSFFNIWIFCIKYFEILSVCRSESFVKRAYI